MLTDIQTYRSMSEQEVLEINYITKRRALRYVAGGEREWLFPERYLSSTHWNKFGQGLLLMPEPREIHMGGEVMVSYKGGGVDAWNEYGHRPWEKEYQADKRSAEESKALAHAAATAGFSIQEPEIPRETDCLLEGSGFEPSVPLPRLSSIRAVRAEMIGRSTDVFRRDREFDVTALQGRPAPPPKVSVRPTRV
jgi:hypothetical protein